MLDPILRIFEKLVLEFSWRRLFSFFLFIVLIYVSFLVFENYTGYFHLRKLERVTALLSELKSLSADEAVQENQELSVLHSILLSELKEVFISRPIIPSPSLWVWKFLAGAALWFLFSIFFAPGIRRKEPDAYGGLAMTLVFGGIFGAVGAFLPKIVWPWFNFVIYPIAHFFIVVSLVVIWHKSRKAKETRRMA